MRTVLACHLAACPRALHATRSPTTLQVRADMPMPRAAISLSLAAALGLGWMLGHLTAPSAPPSPQDCPPSPVASAPTAPASDPPPTSAPAEAPLRERPGARRPDPPTTFTPSWTASPALPESDFRPVLDTVLSTCWPAAEVATVDCTSPPCVAALRAPPPPGDASHVDQGLWADALAACVAEHGLLLGSAKRFLPYGPVPVRCGDTVEDAWLVALTEPDDLEAREGGLTFEFEESLLFRMGQAAGGASLPWPCHAP